MLSRKALAIVIALSAFCAAQSPGGSTLIGLRFDGTLLKYEDHGESLVLYVRGRFVQDFGPSRIPEDMLNGTDGKGISIAARNKSDQIKLDSIRAQVREMLEKPLHIGMSSPVYMNRGGIVFFDLQNSTVTITERPPKFP